jgi:hypothetical protein
MDQERRESSGSPSPDFLCLDCSALFTEEDYLLHLAREPLHHVVRADSLQLGWPDP